MFPCEDSKTLSVCPYPEVRTDRHEWRGFHQYYNMETQKNIFFKKNAYRIFSAVVFCKQFLAYAVHIWQMLSFHPLTFN